MIHNQASQYHIDATNQLDTKIAELKAEKVKQQQGVEALEQNPLKDQPAIIEAIKKIQKEQQHLEIQIQEAEK